MAASRSITSMSARTADDSSSEDEVNTDPLDVLFNLGTRKRLPGRMRLRSEYTRLQRVNMDIHRDVTRCTLKLRVRKACTNVMAELLQQPELLTEVLSYLDHRELIVTVAVSQWWNVCSQAVMMGLRVCVIDTFKPVEYSFSTVVNVCQPRENCSCCTKLMIYSENGRMGFSNRYLRTQLLRLADLKYLDLAAPNRMDQDTFFRVVTANPDIECMDLSFCSAFTSKYLMRLSKFAPALRVLRLEGLHSRQTDTAGLISVVRSCSLQVLSLKNSDVSHITADLLATIAEVYAKSTEFRVLRLGGKRFHDETRFTPDAIVKLLDSVACMTVLQLPPVENYEYDRVFAAAARHPALHTLVWNFGANAFPRTMSDVSFLFFAAVQPSTLQVLKLRRLGPYTTEAAVLECLRNSVGLKTLNLTVDVARYPPAVNIFSDALIRQGLLHCARLESVTLAGVRVSAEGIFMLLKKCRKLTKLKLGMDISLFAKAALHSAVEAAGRNRLAHFTLMLTASPAARSINIAPSTSAASIELSSANQRKGTRSGSVAVAAVHAQKSPADHPVKGPDSETKQPDPPAPASDAKVAEPLDPTVVATFELVRLITALGRSSPALCFLKLAVHPISDTTADGVTRPSDSEIDLFIQACATISACASQVHLLHFQGPGCASLSAESPIITDTFSSCKRLACIIRCVRDCEAIDRQYLWRHAFKLGREVSFSEYVEPSVADRSQPAAGVAALSAGDSPADSPVMDDEDDNDDDDDEAMQVQPREDSISLSQH